MRAALVLTFSGASCEALVPADLPPYTCRGSDSNSCPPDFFCSEPYCTRCDAQHCDPGADASIDAAGPPDGQSPEGSASDGTSGDAACGGALGCGCTNGLDCAGHLCGDAAALSSAFIATNGARCTQTCCTSADCPGDFVCYGAGTGGNYCVSPSALGRPSPVGSGGAGSPCSGPGACRSAVCTAGRCLDTCCADAGCAAPTVCSLTAGVDGHASFVCVVHAGAALRAGCSSGPMCASGECSVGTCRPHCCGRSSALAMGYHTCELDSVGSDIFAIGAFPTADASGGDFGASCTARDQCKSRLCDIGKRTCSDVCCVDADCAAYGAFVCRPAQRGPSPRLTNYLICVAGP